MVECFIDGNIGYPDMSSKIKITRENQFIKDSGEYTYQINFPMSILENREIFANVNRIDVSKETQTFEDCRLVVNNRTLVKSFK